MGNEKSSQITPEEKLADSIMAQMSESQLTVRRYTVSRRDRERPSHLQTHLKVSERKIKSKLKTHEQEKVAKTLCQAISRERIVET